MTENTDLYNRLNIPPGASQEEIRRAYRRAVKKAHPDVNKQQGATEFFLDVQEAYKVLSNPKQKQAYDEGREPEETSDIKTAVTYSRDSLFRMTEPQIIYALVNILTTEEEASAEQLPLNLSLVLDTSTSMQGNRLQLLKAATRELTRDLSEEDRISVISFNDRASVQIPSLGVRNPSQMEAKINSLIAEGGTEIFQGLDAGFNEIQKAITANYVNHIILITDGHTYGDENKCFALAKNAAKQDIGISGLGIGNEWNDEFIDDLSSLTGGQSSYIEHPREVKNFLEKIVSNLKRSYSKNVTLHLNKTSGVNLLSAYRLLPDTTPLPPAGEIQLGSLNYEQPHQLLLEFLVEPVPEKVKTYVIADTYLHVKRKFSALDIPLTLNRPIIPPEDEPGDPPDMLYRAVSRLTLYRLQEKAKADVEQGKPDVAYHRLINLASHLMAKGEQKLSKVVMEEAEHINKHHTFSADGEKQIKYGTRRLMLPNDIATGPS